MLIKFVDSKFDNSLNKHDIIAGSKKLIIQDEMWRENKFGTVLTETFSLLCVYAWGLDQRFCPSIVQSFLKGDVMNAGA